MAKRASGAPAGVLSKLEGRLKARYLGIGFLWAWIYDSFETFAVYPERTGIGINADASWIVSASTVVVALFAAGVLLGRRTADPPRWLPLFAGAATAAGTALSASVGGGSPLAAALVLASGIFTGLGSGVLYVLWGQALARLDTESAELAIPAASTIIFACALVLPYLPAPLGTVATASLPLISCAMLWLTVRDIEASPEGAAPLSAGQSAHGATPPPDTATFARMGALLFIAYGAVGFSGAVQPGADAPFFAFGIDWPTLIGSCCGVGLLACFILYTARPRFDTLFRPIAVAVVVACALLPWADLWAVFLSGTLVAVTDTLLTISAVLFVVQAARRGTMNAALGTSITQGSLQLGVLVGNIAGRMGADAIAASPTGLFTVALGLVAFFSFAWLLYPADRTMAAKGMAVRGPAPWNNREGNAGNAAGTATGTAADGTAPRPASESALDERCRELTERCGLSGREAEILAYLARGRSQPYIREELVLSKNTVATHVKHIYQKLNVHSRQELIDLFE